MKLLMSELVCNNSALTVIAPQTVQIETRNNSSTLHLVAGELRVQQKSVQSTRTAAESTQRDR